jgi:1,4-alpha-glucan branching enzyme
MSQETLDPGATASTLPAGITGQNEHVTIELHVAPSYGAARVDVAGDFSAWVPIEMVADRSGGFAVRLVLPTGCCWRYRFRFDGRRWVNDPSATDYVPGPNGAPASELRT